MAEVGVDPAKMLAAFDFSAVPELNRGAVLDLGSSAFVPRAENVILAGPTGVGKSHLMNALVIEALKRGYSALHRPAHRVLADLQASRAGGTYRRRLQRRLAVDLLAPEDVGLRPLSPEMAEDLYELIRERYERKALILISNRALVEWPEAFGSPLLANAALNRLTHLCHTLIIRGQSYRQRGRRKEYAIESAAPQVEPIVD